MSMRLFKKLPTNAKFSTLAQLRNQIKAEQVPLPSQSFEKPSVQSEQSQGQETENEIKQPISKNVKFPPMSDQQKAYLDRVIRVDQAGELGANYIYAGQYFVLAKKYPHLQPVLKHMWEQEIHHHNTFNNLQVKNRVRPSLLTPLWKFGAFSIGALTASLSKEAAMACTVAVETVIGGHYNDQLRVLGNKFELPAKNLDTEEIVEGSKSNEMKFITSTIKKFRDDELDHLDTAVEHNAEEAVPYWILVEAIKSTCKGAIWTAERI